MTISRREEENIGRILDDVRRSSSAGETSQTRQTGFTAFRSHTDPGVTSAPSSSAGVEEMDCECPPPTSADEKLKKDLIEKRTSNAKYLKMMAS